MSLSICPWKHGKRWAYSITYDEALADLHRFAVPLHEELGIPGHVEVVVGQLGQVRNLGASSYNGFRHMSGPELRDLLARGWGVGNHSWSHEVITPETVDRELRQAREVLEEAVGAPVDLYCAPGDNTNMSGHVLEACRALGYLGAMSITDAVNRPEEELFWLNRTPLHDQYYGPFFSEYDPFRNLRHAQQDGGWIIDYCHCPLEQPVHRNKDCSESQLRRRFEAIRAEGGEQVWCAVPEEVIYYHLCRRHAVVETLADSLDGQTFRVSLPGLSHPVVRGELTFEARVPAAWCRFPRVRVAGTEQSAQLVQPGVLRVTAAVNDGVELAFGPAAPWAGER
ncbi:MAG: polysaccharide deacetylase family protein [Candidatus Latescibacterota bacterium]